MRLQISIQYNYQRFRYVRIVVSSESNCLVFGACCHLTQMQKVICGCLLCVFESKKEKNYLIYPFKTIVKS